MKNNLVKDWMSPKVLSVSPDASLTEADVMMEARQVRRLLVMEEGQIVGVLTLGDLRLARARLEGAGGEEPRVRDLMTPDPITVSEDYSIGLAAQTLLAARISGLPVVNEAGELVGILSESDIFRYVIEISRGE